MLAGCATVDDHLIINEEGKILREIVITIDKTDKNYSEEAEQIAIEKIKSEFEEKLGYKYDEKNIISEGKKVIRLIKPIESIDKNNTSVQLFGDDETNMFTISKKEGFFSTHYIANNTIDTSFLKDVEGLVDYQLNIHFPSKVNGVHNAQHVANNGKTLSWKADENQEITLKFDASLYNYGHIYLVVGPVVLVLILIFYFYRKKNQPVQNKRRIPVKERWS
jgi:hypothetical protein